jgi:hypothetical protein
MYLQFYFRPNSDFNHRGLLEQIREIRSISAVLRLTLNFMHTVSLGAMAAWGMMVGCRTEIEVHLI